jgi:hypothetical protein
LDCYRHDRRFVDDDHRIIFRQPSMGINDLLPLVGRDHLWHGDAQRRRFNTSRYVHQSHRYEHHHHGADVTAGSGHGLE